MELKDALQAKITAENESCSLCGKELATGERVILGEHRLGGKFIGKTVRARACLGCAQDLVDILTQRIREARAL